MFGAVRALASDDYNIDEVKIRFMFQVHGCERCVLRFERGSCDKQTW